MVVVVVMVVMVVVVVVVVVVVMVVVVVVVAVLVILVVAVVSRLISRSRRRYVSFTDKTNTKWSDLFQRMRDLCTCYSGLRKRTN